MNVDQIAKDLIEEWAKETREDARKYPYLTTKIAQAIDDALTARTEQCAQVVHDRCRHEGFNLSAFCDNCFIVEEIRALNQPENKS